MFEAFGRKKARALGFAGLPIVSIPHPITGISLDTVHTHADGILESVAESLTETPPPEDEG